MFLLLTSARLHKGTVQRYRRPIALPPLQKLGGTTIGAVQLAWRRDAAGYKIVDRPAESTDDVPDWMRGTLLERATYPGTHIIALSRQYEPVDLAWSNGTKVITDLANMSPVFRTTPNTLHEVLRFAGCWGLLRFHDEMRADEIMSASAFLKRLLQFPKEERRSLLHEQLSQNKMRLDMACDTKKRDGTRFVAQPRNLWEFCLAHLLDLTGSRTLFWSVQLLRTVLHRRARRAKEILQRQLSEHGK